MLFGIHGCRREQTPSIATLQNQLGATRRERNAFFCEVDGMGALLVSQYLRLFVLISCVYVGLHLPRSFAILFLVPVLVLVEAFIRGGGSLLSFGIVLPAEWRLSIFLSALFSISYVAGFLGWGFWSWSSDRADIINALFLPTLLFWAGLELGLSKRGFNTSVFLSYTLGSLVFVLLALAWSRTPWWDLQQVFPSAITVPWGSQGLLNVRSVEQNGFAALLLIGPAITLFLTRSTGLARFGAVSLFAAALLGGHAVWALNGRLGWLALLLSLLPAIPRLLGWLRSLVVTRGCVVFASAALLGGVLIYGLRELMSLPATPIWSQGLCDERLGLFGAMLSRLHEAPWGGKRLVVEFLACGTPIPLTLSAEGGSVTAAHNVFLDIYFAAGVFPFVLLLFFLVRPLVSVARGFVVHAPYSDWQSALRWSWVCSLVANWLFQPLLYSDGLLYYFSFMALGIMAQEFRLARVEPIRLPKPMES